MAQHAQEDKTAAGQGAEQNEKGVSVFCGIQVVFPALPALQLVEEQHQKALNILKENEGKLHELADYLYQHETITGQEFMDILERKALPEQK